MIAEEKKMKEEEEEEEKKMEEEEEESKLVPLILPIEVVMEILCWLPLKPLARAQLVSREWRALIQDHHFTEKHMERNSFVHYYYNVSFSPSSTPKSEWGFCFLHGCHGLLLFRDNLLDSSYLLWNPASRLLLELPPPHIGNYGLSMFFVPATGNYKIVSFFKDKVSGARGCQLLTPGGTSMEWRLLGFPQLANGNAKAHQKTVVPVGGDAHFVVLTKGGRGTVAEVVSVDVEAEVLTVNRLPRGVFAHVEAAQAVDCDGKLGFAAVDEDKQELQVMVLQDFKRKRWSRNKEVTPLPFLKEKGFEGRNVDVLFIKEGGIWFWLENEKIFVYTIETGKIRDVEKCKDLVTWEKLYSYKPSLVSVAGMREEGDDDKIKKQRPRHLLLNIG